MVTLLKNRARIYRRYSGHFSAHRTFSRLLESFLLIVPKKLLLKTFLNRIPTWQHPKPQLLKQFWLLLETHLNAAACLRVYT